MKNYTYKYNKFIENRKNRNLPKNTYVENHHIIPKYFAGDFWQTLLDDNWNKIDLLPEEHIEAHYLLAKATNFGRCWNTVWMLLQYSRKHGDKSVLTKKEKSMYTESRIKRIKSISGQKHPCSKTNMTKEKLLEKGRAAAKTRKETILENGLTIDENNGRILSKMFTSKIVEDGLTLGQAMSKKAAETMSVRKSNGKTIREEATEKMKITKNTIGADNLTNAQRSGKKISKTKKENGSHKGPKNIKWGTTFRTVFDFNEKVFKQITKEEWDVGKYKRYVGSTSKEIPNKYKKRR